MEEKELKKLKELLKELLKISEDKVNLLQQKYNTAHNDFSSKKGNVEFFSKIIYASSLVKCYLSIDCITDIIDSYIENPGISNKINSQSYLKSF